MVNKKKQAASKKTSQWLKAFDRLADEDFKITYFLFKFFLILAVLYYSLIVVDFSALENVVANGVGKALNLMTLGNLIFIQSQPFMINSSCTGLQSVFVLFAVIFSLQLPKLSEKIKIFLAGSVMLFVINLIRLYFVLWAGVQFGISTAELLHVVSWFVMTFAILGIWFFSVKKTAKIKHFNQLL